MIDPLRYRSLASQIEFDEVQSPLQCWQCVQRGDVSPAFFLCHDCGKVGSARPYCQPCFFNYHARKRGKHEHKPHPIVGGEPVVVQTLEEGNGLTFSKMHEWVTLEYSLTTHDTPCKQDKQPLTFQSGCSGPCVHFQLLGCTDLGAADILGYSDPYCAVYWKDALVGVTTTKYMTLNPKWTNQTFILPMSENFQVALRDENIPLLFNDRAALPKLRIDVYDWDSLSKNDFLGRVLVSDADILSILRRARHDKTCEEERLSFPLGAKQSSGKLGLRVALHESKLLVHVVQGEDLPIADPFSLSDPYCKVYWNNEHIGSTEHINDTLCPSWDTEVFEVDIGPDGLKSVEQSRLRVECLDWDRIGSHDLLGQVELDGPQLLQLIESNGSNSLDGLLDENGKELGEVDINKIQNFIRKLKKSDVQGKGETDDMIVGVPQLETCMEVTAQDVPASADVGESDEEELESQSNADKDSQAETSDIKKSNEDPSLEDSASGVMNKEGEKKQDERPDSAEKQDLKGLDDSLGVSAEQYEHMMKDGPNMSLDHTQAGQSNGDSPTALLYRDAHVKRFEKDRGILVEYQDNNTQQWIVITLIPSLKIKEKPRVVLSPFQRIRQKMPSLFHLHNTILQVKRSPKALLEVSMEGSQMQWYQLKLKEEESASDLVQGSVDARFLFHTRGTVLRGLDIAVSHMSLGERAKVEVRSDYAFGEVYAGFEVPPYSTLVFDAQVMNIGQHNAKWFIRRRGAREKCGRVLQHAIGLMAGPYYFLKDFLMGKVNFNKKLIAPPPCAIQVEGEELHGLDMETTDEDVEGRAPTKSEIHTNYLLHKYSI